MIVTDSMNIESMKALPKNPALARAFVPTMGALHEGHRTLMREARALVGVEGEVVVSVFVNPTQFGRNEDFDRYPRTFEADSRACAEEGVDVLYAPTVQEVYGEHPEVTVQPGPLGSELEGHARSGHFAGMLTVVSILLHQVGPNIALFGEKDYQQLELVRRMCRDLAFPVAVVGVPTVRERDGLALSSRNAYLSDSARAQAAAIPRALAAGAAHGDRGAGQIRHAALAELEGAGLEIDYVEVRSVDLGPAPQAGPARLLVAVQAGTTRLIDNCSVHVGPTEQSL
jgi:pantoate--beta-alanine ligase